MHPSACWCILMHADASQCTLMHPVHAGASHSLPSSPADPLLLQLPVHAVLEGDALSLQCKAQNREISSVSFYHEWKLLQEGHRDQLQLPAATQQHSGRYRCTAYVQSFFSSWSASSQWLMSSYSNLVVQELFSVPELKVEGPQPPPEGSPLPLLCATRRNALRPHVPLQFFFYRDGSVVAGPQSDPQHTVQELLLSHSGSYSCMVQMGHVQKRSPPVTVTVRSERAVGQGGAGGGPMSPQASMDPPIPIWVPISALIARFPSCSQVLKLLPQSPHPFQAFPLHPTSSLPHTSPSPTGSLHPSPDPHPYPGALLLTLAPTLKTQVLEGPALGMLSCDRVGGFRSKLPSPGTNRDRTQTGSHGPTGQRYSCQ
ncbi:Fc receptor-like A [Coturnix japonica]|uniref:Fc receptor-like A n=1 Tax=Coturnix japonica TaxID=93934 RepID=UPI000777CF7E|nr:Fc receptor-like A [Coturnix japonica]